MTPTIGTMTPTPTPTTTPMLPSAAHLASITPIKALPPLPPAELQLSYKPSKNSLRPPISKEKKSRKSTSRSIRSKRSKRSTKTNRSRSSKIQTSSFPRSLYTEACSSNKQTRFGFPPYSWTSSTRRCDPRPLLGKHPSSHRKEKRPCYISKVKAFDKLIKILGKLCTLETEVTPQDRRNLLSTSDQGQDHTDPRSPFRLLHTLDLPDLLQNMLAMSL